MSISKYAVSVPRVISDAESERVQAVIRLFNQLHTLRSGGFAGQWEETAELIAPNFRNTFYYGTYNWPGQKKTDHQIDSTGMLANSRFGAICDSLLTPRNMLWHGLQANDDYVMKDRQTRLWFELAAKILFKLRYAQEANFASQNQMVYQSLGAFGNGCMFVDPFFDFTRRTQGFRYRAIPLGETFIRENHQGLIDTLIRWFRLTAHQAETEWPGQLPANMHRALEQDSEMPFNFLHCVRPNPDYDPERLDWRGMAYCSEYVAMEGKCLMQDVSGYHVFPYPFTRYEQFPGESYGRGPATMVLPALKTSNAQKRTFLKQGHRAADPVLLLADDGLMSMSLRPGALNKGGVTADGKALVQVLPTGNIQITKEMMEEERALIKDAFLVTLFQILTETPQMTATEVIERTNEKGILIAPTLGRQQSEYLGPLIHRELDIAARLNLLPPMPPRLREARGSYKIVYTTPLARTQRAGEASGFMRTLDTAKEVVAITGDPSILDAFNFDTAIPEIATDIQNVPERWMFTPQQIAQKRQMRAKAQQIQQQIQAMPAQAAMMKARAVAAKTQAEMPMQQGMDQQQQPMEQTQ